VNAAQRIDNALQVALNVTAAAADAGEITVGDAAQVVDLVTAAREAVLGVLDEPAPELRAAVGSGVGDVGGGAVNADVWCAVCDRAAEVAYPDGNGEQVGWCALHEPQDGAS